MIKIFERLRGRRVRAFVRGMGSGVNLAGATHLPSPARRVNLVTEARRVQAIALDADARVAAECVETLRFNADLAERTGRSALAQRLTESADESHADARRLAAEADVIWRAYHGAVVDDVRADRDQDGADR